MMYMSTALSTNPTNADRQSRVAGPPFEELCDAVITQRSRPRLHQDVLTFFEPNVPDQAQAIPATRTARATDCFEQLLGFASGNDSGPGTQQAPWATLQHAANFVFAGDTVDALPGNYQGFNITKSGTASAPITFHAEPGAVINKPMSWGGTVFGINASGPSYNVIDGFTITAQPNDPAWYAGIRMGGIWPGGAVPNWAVGNVIRNNTVQLRKQVSSTRLDALPIYTSWQDGLLVQNNTASGGWDSGIYISNSSKNYIVRGNTVFNVGGNGIHNNGDAGQGGPGINTNALIENNIIHDVGFISGGQAISCDGVQNSTIRNNLIYNAYAKGISLYVVNAADGSKNNIVVNNTVVVGINGSAGAAMRVSGGNYQNTI